MSSIATRLALAASLSLAAVAASPVRAEDAPAPAREPGGLTLKTERVVVFKDGYGLFVKSGTGTADAEGRLSTAEVPAHAVLGCVWATSAERKVLGMRAGWVEKKSTRRRTTPCLTTLELLRANVGRPASLGLTREGAANVGGTILEVLESPPPADPAPPARPTGPAGTTVREAPRLGGQIVVIQMERERIALPVAEVRTVTGVDLKTTIDREEEVVERSKRLAIDLGRDAAGKPATVRLLYFGEGIRWIPTYRVGGGLATDADLALQGEVLNEAEDLTGVALDLVVGVPSFRFKDVASPLTLEATLQATLRQAAPQLAQQMENRLSNVFDNYQAGATALEPGAGGLDAAPELAAEAHQDLFVYGVGQASLVKGDRATFPLWQSTAALRHLYTMDVRVVRNPRSGEHAYRSAKSAVIRDIAAVSRESSSPVWHELELANASTVPWTTGAALLLKGDVPLGQNVLTYTSPGAKSLLPMTVAVDLRGTWTEQELDRKGNVLAWSGVQYSQVLKKGNVTLTSRRKEPSLVRVTVGLGGRVESASDNGAIVLNDVSSGDWADSAHAVNNHSDVTWELTLAPGETKSLEVRFSFYVR
jgi:hypothetical protein